MCIEIVQLVKNIWKLNFVLITFLVAQEAMYL